MAAVARLSLGLERRVVCVSGSAWGRLSQASVPPGSAALIAKPVPGRCWVYRPLKLAPFTSAGRAGRPCFGCLFQSCSSTQEADPPVLAYCLKSVWPLEPRVIDRHLREPPDIYMITCLYFFKLLFTEVYCFKMLYFYCTNSESTVRIHIFPSH